MPPGFSVGPRFEYPEKRTWPGRISDRWWMSDAERVGAMSSVAEALKELHRLHVKIGGLKDQLARGPRQIAVGEKRVATLQEELERARESLKRARILADEKQLQLKTREDRIVDLQGKLNTAASNREYQTLKEQIEADRQANAVLTDEILELLERIDRMAEDVEQAEQRVKEAEKQLGQTRDRVAEISAELKEQLEETMRELAGVEVRLPDELRREYERVVRARGSEGLAGVDSDSCGACHQTLTSQMLNELALGKPVFCPGCGAILFRCE